MEGGSLTSDRTAMKPINGTHNSHSIQIVNGISTLEKLKNAKESVVDPCN